MKHSNNLVKITLVTIILLYIGIVLDHIEGILTGRETNILQILLCLLEVIGIILSIRQVIKPSHHKIKYILSILLVLYFAYFIDLTYSSFNLKPKAKSFLLWEDFNHLIFVLVFTTPLLLAYIFLKKFGTKVPLEK